MTKGSFLTKLTRPLAQRSFQPTTIALLVAIVVPGALRTIHREEFAPPRLGSDPEHCDHDHQRGDNANGHRMGQLPSGDLKRADHEGRERAQRRSRVVNEPGADASDRGREALRHVGRHDAPYPKSPISSAPKNRSLG